MLNSAVLVLAIAVGQTDMTSTAEEFQELGKLRVGRWTSEVTLIADWPGLKKKAGEKLVVYGTVSWAADQKAMTGTGVGGENTGIFLSGYDAASKQIILRNFGSAGGNHEMVIWKESPTKWAWKVTGGGLPDGKKFGGTGHWIFSDDGKTLNIRGDVTIDGKPAPLKLDDVHTRLDK